MTYTPLISVIVPIYNAERYLNPCLQSIVEQNYTNLEIILINDGSNDQSLEIIQSFASTDSRISLYSQKNCGLMATRNRGIKLSTGEFVHFVDADDSLELDFYDNIIPSSKDKDVVCFGYSTLSKEDIMTQTHPLASCPDAHLIFMTAWSKLYRRTFLLEHDILFPNLRFGEDLPFMFNLWGHEPRLGYSDSIGYLYRENNTSLTHTVYQSNPRAILKVIREITHSIKPHRAYYIKNKSSSSFALLKYALYALREVSYTNIESEKFRIFYHGVINNIFTVIKVNQLSLFPHYFRGEKLKNNLSIHVFLLLHYLGLSDLMASLIYLRRKNKTI